MKSKQAAFWRTISSILMMLLAILTIAPSSVAALSQNDANSIYNDTVWYLPGGSTGSSTCSTTGAATTSQTTSVYFVGDSLMVGMQSAGLQTKVAATGAGVSKIEATVGDSVAAAFPKIQSDSAQIKASDTVVVELGTNPGGNTSAAAGSFTSDIKEVVNYVKSVNSSASIFWMNAYADNDKSAYSGVNADISNQSSQLGYSVIDWHSEASNNNSKYAPFAGVPGPPLVHPSQHYSELADFVVGSIAGSSASGGGDCSCSVGTPTNPSDAEKNIWEFLISQGLTPVQAAGVMGNLQQESGFDSKRVEDGWGFPKDMDTIPPNIGPQGQPGYGIAQWTSPSRKDGLAAEAKAENLPPSDLGVQEHWLWKELTQNYTDVYNTIKGTSDLRVASDTFGNGYEGFGTDSSDQRYANAQQILIDLGSDTGSGNQPPVVGGSGTGCGGTVTTNPGNCTATGIVDKDEYSQAQLTQIFGDPGTADSHSAMDANLTNVDFVGHSVSVNKKIASCLEAVAADWKSNNITYPITDMGCYRFDSDNGSSNIGLRSYHTYGAACDINPLTNNFYSNGAPRPYDPNCPAASSAVDSGKCYSMPPQVIQIFAAHGFYWGGNFNSVKDYMHFEWHGVNP